MLATAGHVGLQIPAWPDDGQMITHSSRSSCCSVLWIMFMKRYLQPDMTCSTKKQSRRANIVTEFIHLWINLSHELHLTRPLKLHVLAAHVVDLTMEHRANRRFSVSKMVRAATECSAR